MIYQSVIPFLTTLFFSHSLLASNFLVVEGKLTDSTGLVPIEASGVTFQLEVFSPGSEQCRLYQETHGPINMSSSSGLFSLKLGQGSTPVGDFTAAFNNTVGTLSGLTCASGTTYTPTASAFRKLRISYNTGSGFQTLQQMIDIGASQYARYAYSLQGRTASDFVNINSTSAALTQANLENIFNNATDVTELRNLIDGTSTLYNQGLPTAIVNNNNQQITNLAPPTISTDATNKGYVDSTVAGLAADSATLIALSPGNAGEVLQWDGVQWTAAVPSSNDNTKLPLTGGTLTGALNMGNQDITNANSINANVDVIATQNISAGNDLIANNSLFVTNGVTVGGGIGVGTGINSSGTIVLESQNQVHFMDSTNTNYVSLQSPATVASSVNLILPNTAGGSGQVLSTDGLGQLSWINANAPITDVFGRTGNVVAVAGDYSANQITNVAAGDIASTDVQTAIYELDAEKLSNSGDLINGALTFQTENEIRFADNDDSHYVGFKAPVIITAGASFVWTLPSDDGTSGQVLSTDGSGVLSFIHPPAAGEINTGSNIGFGGVGVFAGKTGMNLEFKNINSSSDKIVIFDDSANSEIDIDVDESFLNLSLIPITPSGGITASNTQNAIYELDGIKLNRSGDSMNGPLNMAPFGTAAGEGGRIYFEELAANGTNRVGFRAPDSIVTTILWELPANDGTNGQVLSTNGAGSLNWQNLPMGDFRSDGTMPMIGQLRLSNSGSFASPSLTFDSDTNTGLFSPMPDEISIVTNGILRIHTDANGRVGIGTQAPVSKLQVMGAIQPGNDAVACSPVNNGALKLQISILHYCDGPNSAWIPLKKSCGGGSAVGLGLSSFCIQQVNIAPINLINHCSSLFPPPALGKPCTAVQAQLAISEIAFTVMSGSVVGDMSFNISPMFLTVDGSGMPSGTANATSVAAQNALCCY